MKEEEKERSWKERLEIFWTYEKVPFFLVLAACIAVGGFLYAKFTERECAFQAILFDIRTDTPEERLEEEFGDFANIDTENYDVLISTSLFLSDASSPDYAMASLAKFQSLIGTQSLDVCMMLEDDFIKYAGADCFLDLREVLSQEELDGYPALYEDAEGHVLGIYGKGLARIEELGGYTDAESIAGIVYNSERVDAAVKFLRFLGEDSPAASAK